MTVFLAVKKCEFVTMHGGSAVTFLTNRNFIFVENIYDSVIRQVENDLGAVLHFFFLQSGFLWRHNLINVRQMKSM